MNTTDTTAAEAWLDLLAKEQPRLLAELQRLLDRKDSVTVPADGVKPPEGDEATNLYGVKLNLPAKHGEPDVYPPLSNPPRKVEPYRPSNELQRLLQDVLGRRGLLKKNGYVIKSRIAAERARQEHAERKLGARTVNDIRQSAIFERLYAAKQGEEPSNATLLSAADTKLCQEVWGSKAWQPGSGDRGKGQAISVGLPGQDWDCTVTWFEDVTSPRAVKLAGVADGEDEEE